MDNMDCMDKHGLSSNIFYSLQKREYGHSISLNKTTNRYFINNVKNNNCTKTIINCHELSINNFDVRDNLAVTSSDDSLKLWDLKSGKCRWVFTAGVRWEGILKILEDKVVCSGIADPQFRCDATIRILDLNEGYQTASITDRFRCDKVRIVANQIFASHSGVEISQWNLKGELMRCINLNCNIELFLSEFLASDKFLVCAYGKKIWMYDLQKEKSEIMILDMVRGNELSSISLNGNQLICGLKYISSEVSLDYCCIVDLEKKAVIHHYLAKKDFLDGFPPGCLQQVVGSQEWTYAIHHPTSKIVAINMPEQNHIVVGKHSQSCYLTLEGQLLVSGSDTVFPQSPSKIKFWDLHSLTKIGEKKLPDYHLNKICLFSGKLFAAIEGSLVQWDFLVSHKGEKKSRGSADQIKKVDSECIIS